MRFHGQFHLTAVVAALLTCAPTPAARQEPVDAGALRALVERFYAAFARQDLAGYMTAISPNSASRAAIQANAEYNFRCYRDIRLEGIRIRRIESGGSGGSRASLLTQIALSGFDRISGKPIAGFRSFERKLDCIHEGDGWRILDVKASADDLAGRLMATGPDDERKLLLDQNPELRTFEIVRSLGNWAAGAERRGDPEKAARARQLGIKIATELGDDMSLALAENNAALSEENEGMRERAWTHYESALRRFQSLGDSAREAAVLGNFGGLLADMSYFERGLEHFRNALTIFEKLRDIPSTIRTQYNLGLLYSRRNNLELSLSLYRRSMQLAENQKDAGDMADALVAMGGVHSRLEQWRDAESCFTRARALFKKSGNLRRAASCRVEESRLYRSQGKLDDALRLSQEAREESRSLGDKSGEATAILAQYNALRLKRSYAASLPLLQEGLSLRRSSKDRKGAALMLQALGQACRLLGKYAEAKQYYRDGIETLGDLEPARTIAMDTGIGGALADEGKEAEALDVYAGAIARTERLREEIPAGEVDRALQFEDKADPYLASAMIFMNRREWLKALNYAERRKARVILDSMQTSPRTITASMTEMERIRERELTEELGRLNRQTGIASTSSGARANAGDLSIRREKVRADLELFRSGVYGAHPELMVKRGVPLDIGPGQLAISVRDTETVLLEYVAGDAGVALFAVTRNGKMPGAQVSVTGYSIPGSPKEIETRIMAMRADMSNPSHPIHFHARWLYDRLLGPAAAALRGKSRLIVIPDGALWDLPFQALMTPDNRYLIEEKEVSVAPSIVALNVMHKMARTLARSKVGSLAFLAVANPIIGTSVQETELAYRGTRLGPLPDTEREAAAVSRLYGASNSLVFVGARASEDRIKRESGRARILHLATHGVVTSRSPLYSHLVLSPGTDNNDGLLEAWEVMDLQLNADLVVLSACETARGRITSGEGAIGLSWAFFVAGCPTTVASQWKVASASTSRLMVEFHRRFRDGATAAAAMRHAALILMRDREFRHPFYWAGFVVTGDGERRLQGR